MAGRQQPWSASQIRLLAPELARRWFVPAARISIFVIYFWFGLLKLIGVSPATPLASALVAHTIGLSYFGLSFKALAIYECAVGILFLVPAATEISVVLLVIHMGIVSSPLILVAQDAWTHPLVPTFEGQYIIKDLALIALAIGILAYAPARRAAAGPATVNLAGQVPAPRLGEPELGPAGRAAAGSKREPASGPPSRSGGG